MDQTVTLTPDVAAWLADLVASLTVTVGHPDAPDTLAIATKALQQLREAKHD